MKRISVDSEIDDILLLPDNTILGPYQEMEEIPRKEELIFYYFTTADITSSFAEVELTISSMGELIILGGIYNNDLIDEFFYLVKYRSRCIYQGRDIYLLAIGYPPIIREEEADPLVLICERGGTECCFSDNYMNYSCRDTR